MVDIITLSGRAGAGKDTVAEIVKRQLEGVNKKVFCIAYGDYIKALCQRNFGYDDNDKENERHKPLELGSNVREGNQKAWVQVVFTIINALAHKYDFFIITDARMDYELSVSDLVVNHEANVYNVYIKRNHDSNLREELKNNLLEQMAENVDYSMYNHVIDNDKGYSDLLKECSALTRTLVYNSKELITAKVG